MPQPTLRYRIKEPKPDRSEVAATGEKPPKGSLAQWLVAFSGRRVRRRRYVVIWFMGLSIPLPLTSLIVYLNPHSLFSSTIVSTFAAFLLLATIAALLVWMLRAPSTFAAEIDDRMYKGAMLTALVANLILFFQVAGIDFPYEVSNLSVGLINAALFLPAVAGVGVLKAGPERLRLGAMLWAVVASASAVVWYAPAFPYPEHIRIMDPWLAVMLIFSLPGVLAVRVLVGAQRVRRHLRERGVTVDAAGAEQLFVDCGLATLRQLSDARLRELEGYDEQAHEGRGSRLGLAAADSGLPYYDKPPWVTERIAYDPLGALRNFSPTGER